MVLNKKLITSVGLLFLIIAILFNYFSIKNILGGVYGWHIRQPETIQGGLELLVVFLFFCLINRIFNNRKIVLFVCITLVSILYLKLHFVLLPTLLAFFYLESILLIGKMVIKLLKLYKEKGLDNIFISFVVGIVSWSFFALILSLLGIGGFTSLRILTVVMLIISLITKQFDLFTYSILKKLSTENMTQRVGAFFIWILILVQFAKSNTALDYDSIWYGLRPELVLVGNHSLFDQLGLTMFVHYYPKLYELIMIPISNLGDNSFIYAFTTVLLLILCLLIYKFLRFLNINKITSMVITILFTSIPTVSNMGSTAKTDIFTSLLIVMTCYFLYKWIISKNYSFFIYAMCCSFLSFGGKPTSYLYIPLVYFGFLIATIIFKRKDLNILKDIFNIKENSKYYLILTASIVVWGLINYRTFKLTGYPLYPILGSLWEKLGFSLKFPFKTNVELLSETLSIKQLFNHWVNIIFDPSQYIHYVMVWPSNLYIFLFIITIISVLLFREVRERDNMFFLIACTPLMISVIYYISTIPDGGDGNYFIGPVILCSIAFIKTMLSQYNRSILLRIAIVIFIPVHISIMFVSHFSWSWGTSSFDLNITKTEFDYPIYKQQLFEKEGLLQIENYVKNDKYSNCIGIGKEQTLNQISCRFEDIPHINSRFGIPGIVNTELEFMKYMEWAKVKYIIVQNIDVDLQYVEVMKVIDKYKNNPNTIMISDRDYFLLDISNVN